MNKRFILLTALALPLAPLFNARAAVNPAIVSADARWLVYADLNSLRQSPIGKELIVMGQKMQVNTDVGNVGVDWQKLLETIGSATAYGTNISPDPKDIDGTLVIEGKPELRKIAESLLLQANIANPNEVVEITDLPFPAYMIKEQKRPAPKAKVETKEGTEANENKPVAPKKLRSTEPMEVVIAFPPEPILIVSKSKAQIVKARDVFKGSAPSLAKTPSAPLAKFVGSSQGAYLFTASTVPTETLIPENAPQARILKMANAGSIALGERGENIVAHADLVASSDQMGEKLLKILQGLTAMLSLAETNDKELANFLNSAAVSRNGNTVSLELSYSSARLATMAKSLQQTGPSERNTPPMILGRELATWQSEASTTANGSVIVTQRSIPNVTLKNGSTLTFARQNAGPRNVRFERIEIVPTEGGAAMTFKGDFLRTNGPRGMWQQLQFPGADGSYTINAYFQNDPEGKASYAASARDPKAPEPTAPASSPAPKSK
jgi:hypothetical protein